VLVVYCAQTAEWIMMPLGTEVGFDPSDIVVLDGDPAPPDQKDSRAPQFSTPVYCGQTAAWIKMPLGMMVGLGLGQGNIVLDADPAPP